MILKRKHGVPGRTRTCYPKFRKEKKEYSFLAIKDVSHRATVGGSINYELRSKSNYADIDSDTKIHRFDTSIYIKGVSTFPEEHVGENYNISIHADSDKDKEFLTRLSDYHERENNWDYKYRSVKGIMTPVYNPPQDIGYQEYNSYTKSWNLSVWLPRETLNSMLHLISSFSPLYVDVHRWKVKNKYYRIEGLSLDTEDPANS